MIAHRNLIRLINRSSYYSCQQLLFSSQAAEKIELNSELGTGNLRDSEWATALPYEKIPGPNKLAALRNFLPGGKFYKKSRYFIVEQLQSEYGDIVRIPGLFKQKDTIVVVNPKYFEKIYRSDGIWPNRRGLETLTYYRHELRPEIFKETGTLLTSNGKEWGKLRSIVNPIMMQPKTVRIYIPRMDKTTLKFIDRIRKIRDPSTKELPDNFEKEINSWALEQICLVGLDKELNLIGNESIDNDAQKLIDATALIFAKVGDLEFKPSLWKYYETPSYKEIIKAYDTLTDISLKYIEEAVQRFELNDKNDTRSDNEKSVVERLIKIDKNVAVVIANEMFFAGVDTTTTTFTGCMLALSKNPEKQEKLRQEIRKAIPDRNSHLTEEKLKNLPYLRAFMKESLRIYPVVHENLRTSNVEYVVGNYQIPKNTDMLMLGTHSYNLEEHFSDPDKFIPERWLRNQNDINEGGEGKCPVSATRPSNPFVYLPFGFGTRMCVGKRLVDMELEILIIRMVQNFQITFDYDDKDVFDLKLIYTPVKELKFKLTDIDNY